MASKLVIDFCSTKTICIFLMFSYCSSCTCTDVSQIFESKLRTLFSVAKQRGESQNGGVKKTKYTKFSKKHTFPTP